MAPPLTVPVPDLKVVGVVCGGDFHRAGADCGCAHIFDVQIFFRVPQQLNFAVERCRTEVPALIDDGGHAVACHRWTELPPRAAVPAASAPSPALERLMAAFSRVQDVQRAPGGERVEPPSNP